MKNIICLCCFFLMAFSVDAQNFEEWLEEWLSDGKNAFEKVEKNYAKNGNNICGKLIENYGSNDNGKGHFYANLEIASSKNNSRKELHTRFHALKDELKMMSFLTKYEYNESIQRYFGSVDYQKESDGNKYNCKLALKEYGDFEVVMLSFEYHGKSDKTGKLNPLNDKVRKVNEEDTTILAASQLDFNQDIRAIIQKPKGAAAFKALLAAAENDFENIIGSSIDEKTYAVQANFLNPTAQEPHQIIVDKGQMRTELHLRFMELYGAVSWRMEHELKAYLKEILGDEWTIETKRTTGEWSATLKNGKRHKRIVRRNKNGRDYLVIEVIKKPFRKHVEEYPQLLKGNCVEGNCIEGEGKFVFQEHQFYEVSYEGNFKNGNYDGIGFVYLEYFSEDDIVSFDLDHYTDSKKRLLFMGQHKVGKRHGKGIAYAYAKYKDPFINFREASEYFQKEEQTDVFYYVFQEYDADSLQSEELCNFIYYNPNSSTLKINQPFTTDYGKCLSGDCQNGIGVLKINDLGSYEGRFSNGKANGNGTLQLATGESKRFTVYHGIPKYIRTVQLPKGVSRVEAAKRKVWLLANHDCLEGNCYDGKGTLLRISADRFKKYNTWYRGYVVADFKDGEMDGKFQILSLASSGRVVNAYLKNGKLDGEVVVEWPNDPNPYYEYYKDGVQVTKDGQNYSEYLDESVKKAQAEIERRYEEARAAGRRQAAEKAAAAARKRRATVASTKKTKRRHSCSSCRGTGNYWHEVVTQDCTTTYDYTYSSGSYYQTYKNCRDVKNGSYITCPVCGGHGWYYY
ncbi:MAG: hypothetical protein AB8G11_26380 [Saprospiraceae bacterium]